LLFTRYLGKTRPNLSKNILHPQKYALPYTYGATSEPEMITKPEWTPAGVCILGWSRSRSQYFRFEPEPESTLRSVQEPIEIFKGPNFCNDACCCQTKWINFRRVFWPVSLYITKVWHWVGVPIISPLMMLSKLWPMQNTVC